LWPSWIRISIPNADPDANPADVQNECGSVRPAKGSNTKISYKLLKIVFIKIAQGSCSVTYEDGDWILHEAVGEPPHVLRPGGASHHALPVRPGWGGGGQRHTHRTRYCGMWIRHDPAIFVIYPQDANQKLIFLNVFFKGTFTSFFKDKKSKKSSKKQW
jgi:hypothetical protein